MLFFIYKLKKKQLQTNFYYHQLNYGLNLDYYTFTKSSYPKYDGLIPLFLNQNLGNLQLLVIKHNFFIAFQLTKAQTKS